MDENHRLNGGHGLRICVHLVPPLEITKLEMKRYETYAVGPCSCVVASQFLLVFLWNPYKSNGRRSWEILGDRWG